ncbi:MAG: hypothetical protein IPK21_03960 [Haliscomenobacter sp.]|nr:hypothetical protein [Haliscomenobacter sp.]
MRSPVPCSPYSQAGNRLECLAKQLRPAICRNRLNGKITSEFLDLLLRSTNSNPFYLEQLLEYFEEQQLLSNHNQVWTVKDPNIQLSNSINAILTARIDRLSALAKETVKAAAVIERSSNYPFWQNSCSTTRNTSGKTETPCTCSTNKCR